MVAYPHCPQHWGWLAGVHQPHPSFTAPPPPASKVFSSSPVPCQVFSSSPPTCKVTAIHCYKCAISALFLDTEWLWELGYSLNVWATFAHFRPFLAIFATFPPAYPP